MPSGGSPNQIRDWALRSPLSRGKWMPRSMHGSQRSTIASCARSWRENRMKTWRGTPKSKNNACGNNLTRLSPLGRDMSEDLVSSRWALPWKMVDGKMCVKARLAPKGYHYPDSQDGDDLRVRRPPTLSSAGHLSKSRQRFGVSEPFWSSRSVSAPVIY